MSSEESSYSDKYDAHVLDIPETDTDIRINPDFYIHHALMRAQHALINDNLTQGFLQYRMIIEHLESLCKSANVIDDDYFNEIKEYMQTKEYRNAPDKIRDIRLAHYKVQKLTNEIFKNRLRTDPLTDIGR